MVKNNNEMKKNNIQKKIRIFLRILLLFLIITDGVLIYFRKSIFTYDTKYIGEMVNILATTDVKYYNMSNTFEQNINNNKITVVNIIFNNRQEIFLNLQKNNILFDLFGNKINIIDIIINKEPDSDNKNDNVFTNLLDKILDNNIENIIKSNNISNVVVNVGRLNFNNKNILTNNIGNTLIFDEKNNLKNVFINLKDVSIIKDTIVEISQERKFLKKRVLKSSEYYKTNDNDKTLIGEFKNFILVDDSKHYDRPFFVILDSREKNIFLTTINGEIFKMINLNSFCYPNNLKFYNNILYISDMCSGSINYIDSFRETTNIKTLVKNEDLLNIIDFDFIDDNNIFFIRNDEDSQSIYNIHTNTSKYIRQDKKIGYITNLVKYNNKIYFLDISNSILYYYDIVNSSIRLALDLQLNNSSDFNIEHFTMNNDKNIYFLNRDLNKVYIYSDNNIQERNFNNFLNYPKDLEIFRNYFYFLSDNYLQRINFLTREKENISLSFSKYFMFDILDIIKYSNIENGYNIEEEISTSNNKINFIYNNMEFLSNSPSFLLLFKIDNNKIKLINRLPFNTTNSNESVDIDYQFEVNSSYLLYGKVYYKDLEDNTSKIKEISILLKATKNTDKENIIDVIF